MGQAHKICCATSGRLIEIPRPNACCRSVVPTRPTDVRPKLGRYSAECQDVRILPLLISVRNCCCCSLIPLTASAHIMQQRPGGYTVGVSEYSQNCRIPAVTNSGQARLMTGAGLAVLVLWISWSFPESFVGRHTAILVSFATFTRGPGGIVTLTIEWPASQADLTRDTEHFAGVPGFQVFDSLWYKDKRFCEY